MFDARKVTIHNCPCPCCYEYDDCLNMDIYRCQEKLNAFYKSFFINETPTNKRASIKSEMNVVITPDYYKPRLNINAIKDLEDCKKILSFLCDLTVGSIRGGTKIQRYDEVKEYFES